MAVGFVRKDSDFPRHGQKLARQLLRGAGQGPRQADYKAMKPYIDIAEKTKADAMKIFEEEMEKK